MRKIFEYIGLLTLMCFSFFITEKTSMIAKNTDDIMITIKQEYSKYETNALNAILEGSYITPGICGKKVKINDSYKQMKNIGLYDANMYEYTFERPNISLINNYDKYITGGNTSFNNIFIFIELDNSNIKLINDYDFKNYNFIVSSSFYLSNKSIINELMINNSILVTNTSFKDYKQIDNLYLEKKDNHIFCYNIGQDNDFLQSCSSNKSSSISKLNTIDKNYFLQIKQNIINGKFIKVTLNDDLINELKLIESYIISKGFFISQIDLHLREC